MKVMVVGGGGREHAIIKGLAKSPKVDVIYALPEGRVFCNYPMISFDMTRVYAQDKKDIREIDSYEKLKEWWQA